MGNVIAKQKIDFTEEVNLRHFNLLRSVGRGSFGKVRIVERKDTKKLYALKYISKIDCIRMEALTNVLRERNILEELDHPFICNLRFAFQDPDYMYMVLDLMLGGDLRFHISRRRFIESVIRFWVAELACAIRYLHNKGIVHRDIKPDNILLDNKGHVALTDFNIATKRKHGAMLSSQSGTYSYMAPEIFIGQGYDEGVDWWSLGVLFYECVYGTRPFVEEDARRLKKAIVKNTIHFPTHCTVSVSPECVSAIQGFMDRNPKTRLGCGSDGFDRIRNHPFFRHLDWGRLERKEIEPPFVPDRGQGNFDITYDLEELLLEQNPLEARTRRYKTPHHHKYARDLQLIERRFRRFDYLQYERYLGYTDPVRRCVGQPPAWVKPLDSLEEQRSTLPAHPSKDKKKKKKLGKSLPNLKLEMSNLESSDLPSPPQSAPFESIAPKTGFVQHIATALRPKPKGRDRGNSILGIHTSPAPRQNSFFNLTSKKRSKDMVNMSLPAHRHRRNR
ncbi:Serine/threonine kinase [Dispira parvispora]|uniref:Serine/threonine kinase n=1 Tax=Dispira parvispora TaxID=1520584 RepID=A0A9W8AUD4_9FUNG|nr:Serine/threonine kinase [Dispira parvispora]